MNRWSRFACSAAVVMLLGCAREAVDREPGWIPVRVESVKHAAFVPELMASGTIRAAETIPLVATRGGTLRYPPRFAAGLRTGEHVGAGELVAAIANDEAESQLKQSRLQMDAARADYERARRSFELGIASQAELSGFQVRANLAREAFAAAQKGMEHLRVVAPRAGTLVVAKPMASGSAIDGGTVIAELAGGGPAVVEAAIAAADREQLRPGLTARLTRAGWAADAVIREVAPVVDAGGTARVVAALTGGSAAPAPGTGVDVRVQLERRPDVITVPEEALVAGGESPAVFVLAEAEGWGRGFRVKRAAVTTGGRSGGRVEIRSGIREGDRVVVSGADALSDDSVVIALAEGKR